MTTDRPNGLQRPDPPIDARENSDGLPLDSGSSGGHESAGQRHRVNGMSTNLGADDGPADGPRSARGYSWPPFQPGHELSLKHGAYSEKAIAEKAEQVHLELLDQAPWLAEERYAPALLRYLQATAREQLAHNALMGAAKLSPRLLECATAAARLAWQFSDELGLTPAGHQRLKCLVADAAQAEVSIAHLAAVGHEIQQRRMAELTAEQERSDELESGTTVELVP